MKRTVVILLSDKRSGSTIFERELCRHVGIRHVRHTPHTFNETHHWLEAAVVLGLPPVLFSGGQVYPGYGTTENARAYLTDGIQGNVPEFKVPKDDRELVFEGWEALCRMYARPVFFEKSPQHLAHWGALSLMLEWAERTDFEVKFIGMVRNPMAVMYSAQHLFGTDPAQRQFGWLEIQRNLLAFRDFIPKEQFLLVRYEDIIANPVERFGEVSDFIGVERDPQLGAEVHGKSLTKWREDPAFDLELHESVRQMAKHFGYSGEELEKRTSGGNGSAGTPGPGPVSRLRSRLRNRWIRPMLMRIRRGTKP